MPFEKFGTPESSVPNMCSRFKDFAFKLVL